MMFQNCSLILRRAGQVFLAAATLLSPAAATPATPDLELRRAIPTDAIALFVNQFAAREESSPPTLESPATALLRGASAMGLLATLDESTRAWLDAWEALALLSRYPHAVALFDLRAEPNGQGGSRLAELSGALIVDAKRDDQAIPRYIQQLLDRHTNKEDGTLTSREVGGFVVHELADRRLPEWAVISWSATDHVQIVGIGPQAVERVLKRFKEVHPHNPTSDGATHGRPDTPPIVEIEDASPGFQIPPKFWTADAFLVMDIDALVERLGRGLAAKSTRTRDALELRNVRTFGITLQRTGKDVEIREWRRFGGHEQGGPAHSTERDWFGSDWVSPRLSDDRALRALPESASFSAFIEIDPLRAIALAARTYRAARSPRAVLRAEQFWNTVQSESKVDIRKDIAARLGHRWIIHDHPRHALGLPLAWTIMIPVEGDIAALRESVDRLFGYTERQLDTSPVPPWRIHRESAGPAPIWYLNFGLNGPALAITDRWVIVSFSPYAVARNVSHPGSPAPSE